MSYITKFRILHVINHLVGVIAIYMMFTTESYYWLIVGLLSFLYLGIVGVNVSLHRYFSHQSFKTGPIREKILLWSSVLTSLGSPAMWCSVHRLHHATSDTDLDPHNPKRGKLKTWFAYWPKLNMQKRYMKPFLQTKEQKFVHRNYFLLNYIVLVSLLLIDIRLAGFLYALPAVGCFHGAGAIGVITHIWGYRRYDMKDLSRNNVFASILSLGEGWHNNHHAHPGRWWQGETWWEIDPPAFVIKHFFLQK